MRRCPPAGRWQLMAVIVGLGVTAGAAGCAAGSTHAKPAAGTHTSSAARPSVPLSSSMVLSPMPSTGGGAGPSAVAPTLVYADHGVAVVGVGGDSVAPAVWLSTDLSDWREVTPPAADRSPGPGGYPMFVDATFLDETTGWVEAWDSFHLSTTVYGTSDGGASWRVVTHGSAGDHAGDADWFDLVSPRVAFQETIAATAPRMDLQVSTDAGQSWRSVYTGPPPWAASSPSGPFEMPVVFTSATRGFAASGIPPAETAAAGLFLTTDTGRHWQQLTPPLPIDATRCAPQGAVECLTSLPTIAADGSGVLATEAVTADSAHVAFDTTADAGTTWTQAATATFPVTGTTGAKPSWALVSTPTARTWWVVADVGGRLTSRITPDAGGHWSTSTAPTGAGTPSRLHALDSRRALLTTVVQQPGQPFTPRVYVSTDSGHTWRPLALQTPAAPTDPATSPATGSNPTPSATPAKTP